MPQIRFARVVWNTTSGHYLPLVRLWATLTPLCTLFDLWRGETWTGFVVAIYVRAQLRFPTPTAP